MNKLQSFLFIITVCILIYVIYRFIWKRDMIDRIINKIQRKSTNTHSCKNPTCNCNTTEGFELFGTKQGEYNGLIDTTPTNIVSLPKDDKYLNQPIKDYVIKSSYNSAVTGKHVNMEMITYLLHRGVRMLDFEIMLIHDKPMVTYTNDKTLDTKKTDEVLLLDNIFSMLVSSAFVQPTPNVLDPLFIHLRMKSNGSELYKRVAKSIDSTLRPRLYDGKITKKTLMKDIMGKIVIIVDKTIDRNYLIEAECPIREPTCYDLKNYINMESGSDIAHMFNYSGLLGLTQDHVRVEDKCELCTNTKNMKVVLPDSVNINSKNPNINEFITGYGCQFTTYKFYSKDEELEIYENMFDDNKGGILPLALTLDYLKKNKGYLDEDE